MNTNKNDGGNWLADEDGILPNLMKALCHDNRKLVEHYLIRDPKDDTDDDNSGDSSEHPPLDINENKEFPLDHWKRALVFGDESLQNTVLRHVLGDAGSWNGQTTATIKKKKKRNEPLAADEPPIPLQYGIVATHVLTSKNDESIMNKNYTDMTNTTISQSGNDVSGGGYTRIKPTSFFDSGAEVVLNPNYFATIDQVEDVLMSTSSTNKQNNKGTTPSHIDVILYFVRPDPTQISKLSDLIKKYHETHLSQKTHQKLYHRILFIPSYTSICEQILIDTGVLNVDKGQRKAANSNYIDSVNTSGPINTLSIHDLQLDLIPLDKDIVSLEMPNVIKEAYIDNCPSSTITSLSRSILRLQDIIGTIPKIQGMGDLAEQVVSKMMEMRLEEHLWEVEQEEAHASNGITTINDSSSHFTNDKDLYATNLECDVHGMIVLDRKVDLVTPMLSPLTYEGLIDEILKIDCGFVTVDSSLVVPDNEDENSSLGTKNSNNTSASNNEQKEKVALALNGSDTLYAEVRNQNVEKFGSFLQNQAIALKESHSNFTNKDKDLSEIHQFVKQIPIFTKNLQSLTQHIHLAERIKQTTNESSFRNRWQTERAMLEGELCYDTLEDLIAGEEPPWRLLRLFVLQSLTSGGLKGSKYDFFKREIIQTYGYEFMFILTNFEKLGIIRRQEMSWVSSSSPFTKLRQGLNLINSEVSSVDPDDIAYVSSGYAPLTVRLVQSLVSGKSREIMKELPGKVIGVSQGEIPLKYSASIDKNLSWNILPDNAKTKNKKPVLLVMYLGGVTFMEIAALRFLSKRPNFPYEIICCTTKIFNGTTCLQSLI